jgi:hypothetical protein
VNALDGIKSSKGLVIYNKENGTSALSKHVQQDCVDECKKWVAYLEQQE